MGDRTLTLASAALILCALAVAPAPAYIATDRWDVTAANGPTGGIGSPVTVTWSFAPDGTIIPAATSSNLISFLDATFGAGPGGDDLLQRPWFAYFEQSFARLSALSGVTYVYEPHDDGVSAMRSFSSSSFAAGELGVRGDVRLGGKSYGVGNNTLASNYYPDYAEMMINTDQANFFNNPANNYRALRNTLMHELMHGLGVSHVESSDARFLIEPVLSTAFDGPQLDDVIALQRLYGDAREKNGGNDWYGAATPLGALAPQQALTLGTLGNAAVVAGDAIDFLSIDDVSDADYFSFTLAEALAVTVSASPHGATYQMGPEGQPQNPYNSQTLSDLSLALFDSTGIQPVAPTANAAGLGLPESITRELEPGTYYARVSGAHNDVQLYQVQVAGVPIAADDLVWIGDAAGLWDLAATANFHNGSAADVFRNGDRVTFNGAAATTAVTVSVPVAPARMEVASANGYLFAGAAGVATPELIVSGGGLVELANSGNALSNVTVQQGTLRLSGAGNAPLGGAINVAAGATLELVGAQPLAAAARLSGAGQVQGHVDAPGIVAPGDGVGQLTVTGDLTLADSSVLEIEIGGAQPAVEHDLLMISGMAQVDGALVVTLVDGFLPTSGAAYSIVAAGAVIGAFDQAVVPKLPPGLSWETTYLPDEIRLTVSASVMFDPADFNHDGNVDSGDLLVWQGGFGASGAQQNQGDATGDGAVDGADFLAWQQQLHGAPPAAPNTSVPEPASWALVGAVGAVLLAVRPRTARRRLVCPRND